MLLANAEAKGKWKEQKGSETVREGGHTEWLSQPTQQSTGNLSILWAQRCEMSQQPNSNIKLSWVAEGKSRTKRCGERGLLLTLYPSPDLHSSKPFKNQLLLHPLAHIQCYTLCCTFKVLTCGRITFRVFSQGIIVTLSLAALYTMQKLSRPSRQSASSFIY